jgi:hypothetical protein
LDGGRIILRVAHGLYCRKSGGEPRRGPAAGQ